MTNHIRSYSILDEIESERTRQISKGLDAEHDDRHSALEWYLTIKGYLSWALNMRLMRRRDEQRRRLIQAAAMIVAWVEALDRRIDDSDE